MFNSTGIVNGLTSTELGVSWLLPRLIGVARSNDLLFTGRVVDADEALSMGLVSRVLPDDELLDACLDVAESMSRFSPYGLAMTKDVIWANLEVGSLEAAIELEDRNQLMLGFTENLPDAIRAFDRGTQPDLHRRAAPRHVSSRGRLGVSDDAIAPPTGLRRSVSDRFRQWSRAPGVAAARRVALRPRAARQERAWLAGGCRGAPPIHVKRRAVLEYASAAGARTVIETGTYHGDTADYLARHGLRVVTVELSPHFASAAVRRFARNSLVEVVEGDSAAVLPGVIADLDEPLCFWLDGHWSGEATAGAATAHPLSDELRAIVSHPRFASHVVLIDDVRLFGSDGYPTLASVQAQLGRLSYVLHDILRSHAPDIADLATGPRDG